MGTPMDMKVGQLIDMKEWAEEQWSNVDRPPTKKRLGATTDSIALIANNGGKGCILTYSGPGIEACVDEGGSALLDDNGLDDAPDGLSIWEGYYCVTESHTDCGHEYDATLEGKFRPLTPTEWKLLAETGKPWKYED
jgi:hypothetical protein